MLLETIRCENGIPLHLSYHQERCNRSLSFLQIDKNYNLFSLITPPKSGVYRCRFLYDAEGYSIEFHPYTPKVFRSLKLITNDTLEYPLKFSERKILNHLFEKRDTSDDVLIVKDNLLTDTTIANIALQIDGCWLTPEAPLLRGTTRERLLNEGFLTCASLSRNDIPKASKIAIMNAMIGFLEVENGIIH